MNRWFVTMVLAVSLIVLVFEGGAISAVDRPRWDPLALQRDMVVAEFKLLPVVDRPLYARRLIALRVGGLVGLTRGDVALAGSLINLPKSHRFHLNDREMVGEAASIGSGERILIGLPASRVARIPQADIAIEILAALVAALSVIVLAFGRRAASRRTQDLASAIDAIGQGRLETRLQTSGDDVAIDRLADQVNGMVTRLARLMVMLQEQSDHIRHEYGNSAGRMGVYLNRIQTFHGPLPTVVRDAIAALERERLHFIALTEAILNLWRARQGGQIMHELDLAVLVGESVDVIEVKAEDKDIRITTHLQPVKMNGDARMLSLLITNLLDNAVKYTSRGGRVDVACRAAGADVLLIVADNGPGIPIEQRERIFETRQRLSDTAHEHGNGYGLAIVEAIVKLHGGAITVGTSALEGACFYTRFPRAGNEFA